MNYDQITEEQLCPVCENGIDEPLIPRVITVGKIKGEVWCCKSCAVRAVDHIAYAGHLLKLAIEATESEHEARLPPDPDSPF